MHSPPNNTNDTMTIEITEDNFETEVSRLPTLIFFKNGQEVDRILQGASKDNIIARLKACL